MNLIHTLMGNDVSLRKDFIVENAINVLNLRYLIMEFLKASNLYSLNKSTYVNLRWIAYIGQLITILTVQFLLNFNFNYFICISIIFFSILTNFIYNLK